MKFSEAWLREWVNPPVSTEELADQLSMAGLEVDSVAPVAAEFDGVVLGEVLEKAPHPDADKLSVCTVDTGGTERLGIVCGASNVTAGMKVPVALVGATLPGGFKIKKAKLRGVQSLGMICSAAELGLAETSEGIMALPDDSPVGADFRNFLQLNDRSVELDLTPDRGDCLGMSGIAREVGVINRLSVNFPKINAVSSEIDDRFPVHVDSPEDCPRYACRVIRGIDANNVETPLWMQEKLRRSGLRSISPVVDVTNYVMLELGQPMHGFDLTRLKGEIRVRRAKPGERLVLLDGQEIQLRGDTLMIADADKPLAMAGIMGGEGSGVSADTTDILLESAFFSPAAIIGKPRSYGISTDSSHRFERGVDFGLQVPAIERATALLMEIAGGRPGPVVEVVSKEHLPVSPRIVLRRNRVKLVLGIEISDEDIHDILTRLNMCVESNDEGWEVAPPSSRFDIAIEEDLIEEIGRIYGYTKIPAIHAPTSMRMQPEPEERFDLDRAKQALVDRDFHEVITYSFINPELQSLLDPGPTTINLANPISADMSVMRPSLWLGLLQATAYNQSRQQDRVRIFEAGLSFIKDEGGILQDLMLAGLVAGSAYPEQWSERQRGVDFFDLKSDLEAIFALTGQPEAFIFSPGEHPALHPGQTARIEREGQVVGWAGMLHPEKEKKMGVAGPVFLFEIKVSAVGNLKLPSFAPLSRFPSIRRDIAVVVDQDVSHERIRGVIKGAVPDILREISLFDVYTGENIDSGRKSLALGLILQESSHTLTDNEVEVVIDRVVRALSDELQAQLRE